jgi:hypothetical protein
MSSTSSQDLQALIFDIEPRSHEGTKKRQIKGLLRVIVSSWFHLYFGIIILIGARDVSGSHSHGFNW